MEKKLNNTPPKNRGGRFIDRTGERVGYLTITGLSDEVYIRPNNTKELKWNYICDCGNIGSFNSTAYTKKLRTKIKSSCGCNSGGKRDTQLLIESGYKVCGTCRQTLSLSEFNIDNTVIFGLSSLCKKCKSESDKNYRSNPKYREEQLNKKKSYYKLVKLDKDKYDSILKKRREVRDYKYEYNRLQTNPILKSKDIIRKLLTASLKVRNIFKSKLCLKSEEILGCSFSFFKDHIENQFTEYMNWGNHGEWHFDHMVPLSLAKNVEELIKLNHYSNFRPLMAKDNLSKSNIMLDEFKELYHTLINQNNDNIKGIVEKVQKYSNN
jgi:hypothetical protein